MRKKLVALSMAVMMAAPLYADELGLSPQQT